MKFPSVIPKPVVLALLAFLFFVLLISIQSVEPYTKIDYGVSNYEGMGPNVSLSPASFKPLAEAQKPPSQRPIPMFSKSVKASATANKKANEANIPQPGKIVPTGRPSSSGNSDSIFNIGNIFSANSTTGRTNMTTAETFSTLGFSDVNSSEELDIFSKASGSQTGCSEYGSSGLSNSQGPLCLTPEMVRLMTTRGGNLS